MTNEIIEDNKPELFNIKAEQMLLGAIIINSDLLDTVEDIINKDSFYEAAHTIIYEHIVYCSRELKIKANSLSLKAFFDNNELIKTIGGSKYLSVILGKGAGLFDLTDIAKLIQDLFEKRELVEIGEKLVSDVYSKVSTSNSKDIREDHENAINEMQNRTGYKSNTRNAKDIVAKRIHELSLSLENPDYKNEDIIKTDLIDFDRRFKGFKRGELIVLGGRPGSGKSSLSLQIAMNVARQKKNVFFFSLEMNCTEISNKIVSNLSRVDSNDLDEEDLESVNINKEKIKKFVKDSGELLNGNNLYINDTSFISFNFINKVLKRASRVGKSIDMIVVDYLQIMKCDCVEKNRSRELGIIVNGLKDIAKKFNCVVLCLSQLNRGVESRDDKRPFMNDLRSSGEIEQTANMIAFVYRDAYYLQKDLDALDEYNPEDADSYVKLKKEIERTKNIMELGVRKNRRGEVGNIELTFIPEYSLVTDSKGYNGN